MAMDEALMHKCIVGSFDPVVQYLEKCAAECDPDRNLLDTFLPTYFGAQDTKLIRAQGRIMLMGLVSRAIDPGKKFDHVIVLEGREGVRKSSALRVLANGEHDGTDYFCDSSVLGYDERRQQEVMRGVWVFELAELAGMRKADQHHVKNTVTKQEEVARAAYDRFPKRQKRTCIFIGTFNTTPNGDIVEYLNPGDQRRWWPILVGLIDIEALKRDRDQLMGEAMLAYRAGGELFLPDELEQQARAIAATREKHDPLEDALSALYFDVVHAQKTKLIEVGKSHVPVAIKNIGETQTLSVEDASLPFAVIEPTEGIGKQVWLASRHIMNSIPVNRRNDGNAIGEAMRKNGWEDAKRRRIPGGGRDLHRGWLHPLDPDHDPDYDPAA